MVKRGSFAALLGALFAVACDDVIVQPKVVQLKHDEMGARADAGHTIPPPTCSGACCPNVAEVPECYLNGQNPSEYSGAECMAQRDNTGKPRWLLRQTQSISTTPPGNADTTLGGILLRRSELHSEACKTSTGSGGFIQLMDLDRENGVGRTGFAAVVQDQADALLQGLCFAEDTYEDPDAALPAVYTPPVGWPEGLPAPQLFPWKVGPVRTARLDTDFDLKTQREEILKRLSSGDLGQKGFTGIFFLDEQRGYVHGYGPLGYVVTYDTSVGAPTPSYNAIPIREAEITSQLNDPEHPNCSGVFGALDLPSSCTGTVDIPAWSCPPGNCAPDVLGPTKVEGYFLTVEAEQVRIRLVNQTLCYRFPLPAHYDGWSLDPTAGGLFGCRNDPKWDPTDSVNGIPPGDWCATTNSEATPECHDAWKSISYSTFQAFPIQLDKNCPAL